jgi:hypothetical protein
MIHYIGSAAMAATMAFELVACDMRAAPSHTATAPSSGELSNGAVANAMGFEPSKVGANGVGGGY